MAETRTKVTRRARATAEKAAYVAVGAPTAVLKALAARLSDLRETMQSSGEELSSELAGEIEEWVTQGEQVIGRAMSRVRRSGTTDKVRESVRSTRRAAQAGVEKAARAAGNPLDLIDPDEQLSTIRGIGPAYAEQLGRAGVTGISAFLDRTRTESQRDALASESGLSLDLIESWRSRVDLTQIDGIGDSYELGLHRTGVWTMEQLSVIDPDTVIADLQSFDMPDSPNQPPSRAEVERWKNAAAST